MFLPLSTILDLWVRYNKDAAPQINGFSAGSSAYPLAFDRPAWIARGYRNSWLIPGRVQISNGVGNIWVTRDGEEKTNPSFGATASAGSGEYLVLRDGCSCQWLPPSFALSSIHHGLVRTGEQYVPPVPLNSPPYDYLIALITDPTDLQVSIGKTVAATLNTWYTAPNLANTNLAEPPALLVCESFEYMGTRPTLSFGNSACGLWSRYRPEFLMTVNWPAENGFPIAPSSVLHDHNGNPMYVGRGNYGGVHWIGRVQTADTPGGKGVFVPGSVTAGSPQRKANLAEYLVWPNNCNCQWYSSYFLAITKVGLVRSIDDNYAFAVGLKDFGSYQAFASVDTRPSVNKMYYVNNFGVVVVEAINANTKLLVCET
jgi:hypothetical protein